MTPPPDGWTAHDGGPCPVPIDSRVTIMCRNGEMGEAKAGSWAWGHGFEDEQMFYEIIAYRKEPENGQA